MSAAVFAIFLLTVIIVACTLVLMQQGAARERNNRTYLEPPTWLGAGILDNNTSSAAPPTAPTLADEPDDEASDAAALDPEAAVASIVARIAPPQGARLRKQSLADELVRQDQLLERVVQGLERTPPLPHVLLNILTELDSLGSSAKSLGAIVSGEPVLTATLLRAANSAATGLSRDIISVDEAVAYLGYSTVRALVLKMQLAKLLPARRGRGYDSEQLWQHSLVVSQVAGHLAARAGGVEPGLASTIGLLHDIGKLAINSLFPDIVARLWERDAAGAADESFLARERRLFGADHAFMGGFLAGQWKLPQELADAIRLHHLPGGAWALKNMSPELRRATQLVHVANQLSKYSHVYCADMEIDIIGEEMLTELCLPAQLEDVLAARDVQDAMQRAKSVCAATTRSRAK
jgi:putative nucleotidyltransferase with HDIG domain